jgi:DNA polymerase-3 subunit gamma/tau
MLRRRWPEVLETVKGLRRVTWALVDPRNAQVADLDATTLRLAFGTAQLAATFRNGGHDAVVARAVRETLGFDVRVEGIIAEQASRPSATPGAGPGHAGSGQTAATSVPVTAAPQAVTPAQAAASWDEEPPLPEPPDDEPPHPDEAPARAAVPTVPGDDPWATTAPDTSASRPAPAPARSEPARDQSAAAGEARLSARERGMAAAARSSAARSATSDVVDEPSPDDPDITGSTLVGAPLVAQMLGGTVIDEQVDDRP